MKVKVRVIFYTELEIDNKNNENTIYDSLYEALNEQLEHNLWLNNYNIDVISVDKESENVEL